MAPIWSQHKHTIGAISKEIREKHDAGIISYTSLPRFTSLYLIISLGLGLGLGLWTEVDNV